MRLDFGRVRDAAAVSIDEGRCTGCGACVRVCRGGPLRLEDGVARVGHPELMACIACGQCVAACPEDAVSVSGRDLYPSDVLELPSMERRTTFDRLYASMLARRSVREFARRAVEPAMVERILEAASTAPMGLPPSEVGVLVAHGQEKVRGLKDDLLAAMVSIRWLLSAPALTLARPVLSDVDYKSLRGFVGPLVDAYARHDRLGEDWFFYDAPLAMVFFGSEAADPADPVIAATYAMLAGEGLGLGTCMLGFPMYVLKYSAKLRRKYGLPDRMRPGVAVIFGHPKVHYHRALRRRFAEVRRL